MPSHSRNTLAQQSHHAPCSSESDCAYVIAPDNYGVGPITISYPLPIVTTLIWKRPSCAAGISLRGVFRNSGVCIRIRGLVFLPARTSAKGGETQHSPYACPAHQTPLYHRHTALRSWFIRSTCPGLVEIHLAMPGSWSSSPLKGPIQDSREERTSCDSIRGKSHAKVCCKWKKAICDVQGE